MDTYFSSRHCDTLPATRQGTRSFRFRRLILGIYVSPLVRHGRAGLEGNGLHCIGAGGLQIEKPCSGPFCGGFVEVSVVVLYVLLYGAGSSFKSFAIFPQRYGIIRTILTYMLRRPRFQI